MKVIGLTGSSGSGKTTVASFLRKMRIPVVDCDIIAREVLREDTPCLAKIYQTFGNGVKLDDGSLNRKALAQIVFQDQGALHRLNDIMYPQITADIIKILHKLADSGETIAVLDAPTLFESGADQLCDYTVSVLADEGSRIRRILARDDISEDMARKRLASQQSNTFYIEKSDAVIENHGDLAQLEQQVTVLFRQLMQS